MTPGEEQQLAFVATTNATVRKLIAEREDLRDECARLRVALSDAITIARSRGRSSATQHRLATLDRMVVAK